MKSSHLWMQLAATMSGGGWLKNLLLSAATVHGPGGSL